MGFLIAAPSRSCVLPDAERLTNRSTQSVERGVKDLILSVQNASIPEFREGDRRTFYAAASDCNNRNSERFANRLALILPNTLPFSTTGIAEMP